MKLICWNVNGLRACIQKGFLDFFQEADADFFCLQETKLSEGQLTLSLPGYHQYWCFAEKKGYSGTAIFTKHEPLSVSYGIGNPELDNEGRVITLEYPEFYLVNCYTPNAQRELARLDHRMKWDEAYRTYISSLDAKKPTILCGDLNVAHCEIDLKNPKSNRGNAGFSDEERESFSKTLSLGFTDTFRYLHPDTTDAYTWWSYMYHAREKNAGWRIDYFLVSSRIRDQVYNTPIYSHVMGSDHCPIGLELDIPCNGSIWMESGQGRPEVVQPQNKPNHITPKVIIPILALLLLGLGAAIFHGSSKPYEKYVTVHIYEEPLRLTYYYSETSSISATAITDGSNIWPLSNSDYLYSIYSHIDPKTVDSWHPITSIDSLASSYYPVLAEDNNFWLRLDLTEDARKSYDRSWVITAELAPPTDDSTPIRIRSYFVNGDPNCIMGWFVYGVLSKDTKLSITLNTGDETINFQVDATIIHPNYDIIHAENLVTETLVYKVISDPNIQSLLRNVILSDQVAETYRKAVEENGYLANLEERNDANEYLLNWLYNGTEAEQWTAYALLSQLHYRSSLTYEQLQKYFLMDECINSISKENAAALPTKDLLLYVLGTQNVSKAISSYRPYITYDQLLEEFPALQELAQRDDLISVAMQVGNLGNLPSRTICSLLSQYKYKMTAEEEATYLLCQYPSCPISESPVSFIFPEDNCTTEELIRALFVDSGLGALLLQATRDSVRDKLFAGTIANEPIMSELIHRKDLIETLFALTDDTGNSEQVLSSSVLHLSVIQEQMSIDQLKLYEEKYEKLIYIHFTYGSTLDNP